MKIITGDLGSDPYGAAAQEDERKKFLTPARDRAAEAEAIAALHRDGYVILHGLLDGEQLEAIKADFARLHQDMPKGRSQFEGFNTHRTYDLVEKARSVDPCFMHPRVLAIVEGYLDDQIQLSITNSVVLYPGQEAQGLHRDDTYYPIPYPRPPLGINAFWAINDFTAENGATLLVPGSHRHPETSPPPHAEVISAEMPAGSAILFDCSTYHAGGHNRSEAPRIGLNMIFIRAWLRQHENMYLAVPKEVVRTLPRTLQFLLGYRVVSAFMGTVNSHSPLNSLR